MNAPTTNGTGVAGLLEGGRAAYEAALSEEHQLSLLAPISAEEMVEAREELGENVGRLTLLRHAREKRRGRPPGARNKRTDDYAKYLLLFGEDPIVASIKLASMQPEMLIEASKQEKVHSFSKLGEPRIVIERMTYAEAMALIMRARELVSPYIAGKKPVAIVHDFSGIKDLMIEGLTHSPEEIANIVDADFTAIEDKREGGQ